MTELSFWSINFFFPSFVKEFLIHIPRRLDLIRWFKTAAFVSFASILKSPSVFPQICCAKSITIFKVQEFDSVNKLAALVTAPVALNCTGIEYTTDQ